MTTSLCTGNVKDASHRQPPGHWYLFGSFVSQREGHHLDTDVRMFFLFQSGDLGGRAMGRLLGAAVWDKAQTYINGA
jgi:hypothetical protein